MRVIERDGCEIIRRFEHRGCRHEFVKRGRCFAGNQAPARGACGGIALTLVSDKAVGCDECPVKLDGRADLFGHDFAGAADPCANADAEQAMRGIPRAWARFQVESERLSGGWLVVIEAEKVQQFVDAHILRAWQLILAERGGYFRVAACPDCNREGRHRMSRRFLKYARGRHRDRVPGGLRIQQAA